MHPAVSAAVAEEWCKSKARRQLDFMCKGARPRMDVGRCEKPTAGQQRQHRQQRQALKPSWQCCHTSRTAVLLRTITTAHLHGPHPSDAYPMEHMAIPTRSTCKQHPAPTRASTPPGKPCSKAFGFRVLTTIQRCSAGLLPCPPPPQTHTNPPTHPPGHAPYPEEEALNADGAACRQEYVRIYNLREWQQVEGQGSSPWRCTSTSSATSSADAPLARVVHVLLLRAARSDRDVAARLLPLTRGRRGLAAACAQGSCSWPCTHLHTKAHPAASASTAPHAPRDTPHAGIRPPCSPCGTYQGHPPTPTPLAATFLPSSSTS